MVEVNEQDPNAPELPLDNGELRIVRILIQNHRNAVIQDYRQMKLEEELDQCLRDPDEGDRGP